MEDLKKCTRIKIGTEEQLTVQNHTLEGEFPIHWHEFFEIEIVLSGNGICIINDVSYDMKKNSIYFLTSTDFHYINADEETKFINISFDAGLIDEKQLTCLVLSNIKRGYIFDDDEFERICSAADLLKYECETNGACQRQLLQYILNCIFKKNHIDEENLKPENCSGIKKATIFMQLHFREDITLTAIAKEAGYNPSYFSEMFKKITGESYIETLTRMRLGYARMLLLNEFSVADACFLSGFGSLSNFFTAFKKKFGVSPSKYKKLQNMKNAHLYSV